MRLAHSEDGKIMRDPMVTKKTGGANRSAFRDRETQPAAPLALPLLILVCYRRRDRRGRRR